MLTDNLEILRRALERERKAKQIAEDIIETRLRQLYDDNISLSENITTQVEFQKNLIDNLVDGLMVFDFKMNIIKINKEALKLLGTTKNKAPRIATIIIVELIKYKKGLIILLITVFVLLIIPLIISLLLRDKCSEYS